MNFSSCLEKHAGLGLQWLDIWNSLPWNRRLRVLVAGRLPHHYIPHPLSKLNDQTQWPERTREIRVVGYGGSQRQIPRCILGQPIRLLKRLA